VTFPQGKIGVDSDFGKEIGFTSDNFSDWSWLWGKGKTLILTVIISKRKGAFRDLMQKVEESGYTFQIPTPSDRMLEIGMKQGWRFTAIRDRKFGMVGDPYE